jgi:hypothetical protein
MVFFSGGERPQRKSPHNAFGTKALRRFLPEAERLLFIRPPLTFG